MYENVGLTDVEDLAILLYGHHVCTPGAPQILDSAHIVVPSLTVLLTKPYKLSQRSYDVTKCPHEWRDIVTIRTEFNFALIRVSILCQYRDNVTPAPTTQSFIHVLYFNHHASIIKHERTASSPSGTVLSGSTGDMKCVHLKHGVMGA